jgi:hypothetical protein
MSGQDLRSVRHLAAARLVAEQREGERLLDESRPASMKHMDGPDEEFTFSRSRSVPSPDPEDWVDGAPTSRRDQSCAFCDHDDVAWVHPLARDLVTYRQYGKGHTLPAFWALCERCEAIYASGDLDAAVEVMRTSDAWSWVAVEDVAECIRQPLEVFARADLGARRLDE